MSNNSKLPSKYKQNKEKTVTKLSPIQLYLREIAKFPLLKPEEEFDLALKHFEDNDQHAAHRLITSNLRLVVKIANDFKQSQINLLDLVQEGTCGLMQAVKKYNPYKGVRLSSYAAWWIRAYILKYLMDNQSQVKIATTAAQRKIFYNLQKETERLIAEGKDVEAKLIAEKLEVSEKDVLEMQKRLANSDISLDTPMISQDGDSTSTRGEFLTDQGFQSIDEILADKQIKHIFAEYLDEFKQGLTGRDLIIFNDRILSDDPLTLQQIGDKEGISRERARQIEARILKKLKEFVAKKNTLNF